MRLFYFFLPAFLMILISSCGFQYEIVTDKEDQINFSMYKTYSIDHDDHGFEIGANPIHMQRIDRAVKREIEDMGYVQSENSDLKISWFIKIDTKLEHGIYNAYYSKWRYPRAIEVYEYQVGSLVIDFIDTKSGQVVWHAKVSSKIEDDIPNVEEKIKEVVNEVFKSYRKDSGIKKVITYAFK